MKWRIAVGLFLVIVGLLIHVASSAAQEFPENTKANVEAEASEETPTTTPDEPTVQENPVAPEEQTAPEEPVMKPVPKKPVGPVTTPPGQKKGVVILKRSSKVIEKRHPFSLLGASTLNREDTAVRIALGYPEAHAMYHMPWDTDLEFGVGVGFLYGFNAMTTGKFYGGKVMGEARWRFFRDGAHSLALVATPALVMGSGHTKFASGLEIGFPGLVYDYAIKGENHAILGFSVPWGLYVGEVDGKAQVSTRVPMVIKAGMEFALTDLVHLFMSLDMGADLWVGEAPLPGKDGVYLWARGLVGAGFLL
jgi:hypothetical protein